MKKTKRVLIIILLMLTLIWSNVIGNVTRVDASSKFSGYTPISSADDLLKLADSEYGDKYYLTKDIDLEPFGLWESIDEFKGTLDGNGHKIKNLKSDTGGLFASIYEGSAVRNLVLTDIDVKVKTRNIDIGGITGSVIDDPNREDSIVIERCFVTGSISGLRRVGGIIGIGSGVDVTISECGNWATISSRNEDKRSSNAWQVGGIAGSNITKIEDCFNSGSVSSEYRYYYETSGYVRNNEVSAGGIIGYTHGRVENCVNIGDVSIAYDKLFIGSNNKKDEVYVGSIIGEATDTAYTYKVYYNNEPGIGYSESGLLSGTLITNKSDKKSYGNLDFNNVWSCYTSINDGYPYPKWIDNYWQVPDANANKKSGSYKKSLTVTLKSDMPEATIYYTLDGTKPTTKSKKYTKKFTIKKSTTLRVIAVKKGFINSEVKTYKYTIK